MNMINNIFVTPRYQCNRALPKQAAIILSLEIIENFDKVSPIT